MSVDTALDKESVADGSPEDVSLEHAVRDRYAKGASEVEAGLCCAATTYDPALLELLPSEIVEKDYGCGDPAKYAIPGDVVIDLGSGSGKACYILSQKVGQSGRVIGLDFNDAMLSLARKYQATMAERIGYANVEFRKARIQDMALDLDRAATWLEQNPVSSVEGVDAYNAECERLRKEQPLLADQSVDLIVSSCVLNLVRPDEKVKLFREMHRVLKRGGRAVISDIVSDEDPTPDMMADPHLWSGCISGAFREDRFLEMFEEAGFYGIEILNRQTEPWQTVDGIEFRAMTVRAFRGKEGTCWERNQAVIYQGPWKQVRDDDGHVLQRGQRMAVCDKNYQILTNPAGPYAADIVGVEPLQNIDLDEAELFDCKRPMIRDPRQTKGADYRNTELSSDPNCCEPGGDCC
ncbi:MAG: methyltransferase domain-containing protein [Pirellulales bacterium]|nr:methyltransferase domain-containing protein [Pirellulales bacterium]